MSPITVERPPCRFVESNVAAGGFASGADGLAALVTDARRQEAGGKLRALLQAGEESGPPVRMTREEGGRVGQEANEELARRNGHG